MRLLFKWSVATLIFLTTACTSTKNSVALNGDDGKIEVVFVQINDVYEIAPVAGGREGGMARVATLKKQHYEQNKNTFLVMAGDFLSPSVYNSIKYNDKKIRGAQMVDCMNAAGMDFVVFGNHEFDITENELQERINESGFNWIATNTFHKTSNGVVPFRRTNITSAPFPQYQILSLTDKDGTTAKIGILGLTLNSNKADYVSYADQFAVAKSQYETIKDSVDAVVAITHQSEAEDIELAKQLPELAGIMGGHEHSGVYDKIGNVKITKAESNAKTAYVIKLRINKNNNKVENIADIVKLNESVAIDSTVNLVVEKWKKIAEDNYASIGFDPTKVVLEKGDALDGREVQTRNSSTNLTQMITAAMMYSCPKADVVLFNSGSVRLDDVLTPPVTQYDIIRTLPFGGGIRETEMKGSLLLQVLQAGEKNKNSGGYLQYAPIIRNATTGNFFINKLPIEPEKIYRVAITEFLFSGKEANLDFLNDKNKQIVKVYPAETATGNSLSDIRLAIINYLQNKK